jgi:hypothetical protein
MDPERDIVPVTDAMQLEFIEQLKERGEPQARVLEGIRQGLEDMKAGRTMLLSQFKKRVRSKHGIKM